MLPIFARQPAKRTRLGRPSTGTGDGYVVARRGAVRRERQHVGARTGSSAKARRRPSAHPWRPAVLAAQPTPKGPWPTADSAAARIAQQDGRVDGIRKSSLTGSLLRAEPKPALAVARLRARAPTHRRCRFQPEKRREFAAHAASNRWRVIHLGLFAAAVDPAGRLSHTRVATGPSRWPGQLLCHLG